MWILFVSDGTVYMSVVFPTFRALVIIFTARNSFLFVKKFSFNNLTGHFLFAWPGTSMMDMWCIDCTHHRYHWRAVLSVAIKLRAV